MIFVTFLFTLIGLIVRNVHLSHVFFYDWDEAMYAQIAKEIIRNKSLFTTFNGQIWLDKPPLAHTLIAFVFATIGQSEFWARMIMVGISFILLILTYLAAKKLYVFLKPKADTNNMRMAALIPTLLLAASPIFIERTALLNSDTLIAVSWIGYLLFMDSFWIKLFFLVIGVWSKSVMGFYPVIFDVGTWIFISKDKKKSFSFKNLKKLFIFILIPSLWYIAGLIKYKYAFISNHFLSQVLQRITVPIELHVGGKYYYVSFLWEKMGWLNVLFIISYFLYGIYILKSFIKEKFTFFNKKNLFVFIFILAPFPFFAFLTVMKTKIYWYVIMFFPFVCISLTYLYSFIKNRLLQRIFFIGICVYFLISFTQQTFLANVQYTIPDKVKLAQCISKQKYSTLAFLVDDQERKVRNVLEAAHYNTTSSFYYGGSPAFVYYVQKKVDYFYSVEDFQNRMNSYSIVVASKNDINNYPLIQTLFQKKQTICEAGDWVSIVK